MNIRSNPDTTLPAVTTGPLPSSRKIFVTPDEAPDVRVPLREIMLSKGAGEPDLPGGACALDARELREHRHQERAHGVVDDPVESRVERPWRSWHVVAFQGLRTTFTQLSCLCLNVS